MMETIRAFIQEQLATNELFKGGLILGAGAALLTYFRRVPFLLWTLTLWTFTVEIDVPDSETAFKWLDVWLANHKYSKKHARRLTIKTECVDANTSGPSKWNVTMAPAPGRHFIFEDGRLIILTRSREKLEAANRRKPYAESFTLRVIGRNRRPALDLIHKARRLAAPLEHFIDLFESTGNGCWVNSGYKRPRHLKSVVLPGTTREDVLSDINDFLASEEWYRDRGVPYRRGYLFHGVPGSGKTSLILAIASELKWDVAVLNLRDMEDDQSLMSAMGGIRDRQIAVVEDVDCVFEDRESLTNVSLSGLLNAIDGIASHEGHILILTTNHRDRLDSALIRPGRVDMEVEFRSATPEQAAALFKRFYPEADDALAEDVASQLPGNVSMAALQGHFITNKHDPQAAVRGLFSLGTPNEPTQKQAQEARPEP